jgi:hypothetical protein
LIDARNVGTKNYGRLLYPDWSDASDYNQTNEIFTTVTVHVQKLSGALKQKAAVTWMTRTTESQVDGDQIFV